jgi:hypothetical protein
MAKLPVRVPTRTQKADPYYDLEGKHFTPNNWDEIDMSKVDLGFHIDPSPKGLQAADREKFYRYMKNNDGGDTKDLRFRVGNTLIADDVGRWDEPATAREGILNALYNEDLDLASNFEFEFPRDSMSIGSTTRGDKDAIADMDQMRGWLLGNDIDTIQYKNTSEGADEAAELALLDPEWSRYEQEMLEKIEDAKEKNLEAGLGDGPAADALLELEDELEYARDEVLEEAAEGNVSYIALDPGNVRSANAKFDPKNYGKPGMMLGAGGIGLMGAAGSNDAEAGFINKGGKQVLEAFHGSPHVFDRFSMDAIGTGEGAQAYGHGLYFADSRGVAEDYREALTAPRLTFDGRNLDTPWNDEIRERWADHYEGLSEAESDAMDSILGNLSQADTISDVENVEYYFRQDPIARRLYNTKVKPKMKEETPEGALYGVEIDVTPDQLLDWDKPLSEQSEAVQEVLGPYLSDFTPSAGGALNIATDALGKGVPERLLAEKGIKGIKYLDGVSRKGGEGTSNYVIFDDKLINIAEPGNNARKLAANSGAAARGIKSLLPLGTLGALSSLTSEDASAADLPAGVLDVANRTGEMLLNDVLQGSQSLSNAIYDTRDAAPQVQFAPRTEAGDTLSEGILSDLGDVINYRGLGGGDQARGAINLYNEYVSPYLSERQEMGLGGSLLAASTLFPGGKANKIPDAPAGLLDDVDPRMQMTGKANKIPDQYSGALGKTDPRVNEQARLETTNPVVVPKEGLQERNMINLEDYIGRPFLNVQYDPSRTGTLTDVQGVPLRTPVDLTGGQDYMRGVEPGRLTASGESVLKKIDLTRRALKTKYGEDPLFIPSGMQKTGGDFNHMQVATMAEYAGANMPAGTFKKMAQEVKEKTGIDISDPSYIPGLSKVTGDTRKAAQAIMDKYRNEGGISVGEARLATHDPEQVYDNFLNSPSMNMGVLSDSSEILPSRHGTYPASNMGSYEGTFSQRFPVMALDPARLKEIVSGGPGLMTSRNVDINNVNQADIRSMSMAPVGGILEEENVMRALEAGKKQYKVGILDE